MVAAGAEFIVPVEGEGSFTFARRTIRNQIAIDVAAQRLSEGVAVDVELAVFIEALATLTTLTVEAPEGWDPESADPMDPDSYARIVKVWSALRDKEKSFRSGRQEPVSAAG